jgi:hypothetical protein
MTEAEVRQVCDTLKNLLAKALRPCAPPRHRARRRLPVTA